MNSSVFKIIAPLHSTWMQQLCKFQSFTKATSTPVGWRRCNGTVVNASSRDAFVKTNSICRKQIHTSLGSLDVNTEDTFGLLAEQHGLKVFKPVPDDVFFEADEEVEVRREKETAFWYHVSCRKLAKEGKLEECVEMLETRMLKEDKVQPQENNFAVVIGALGRNGQVKKALKLYRKIKEYGLTPSPATYTGIFTAFANSSNANDFSLLMHYYAKLKEKKIHFNRVSFNALLRAYAKRGTLQETMNIFRDSVSAGVEPNVITFTNLILSCENDREAGFLHALQIWKRMTSLGISPDGKALMHFLIVLHHCGIGDTSTASKLLLREPDSIPDLQLRQVWWLKGQESFPRSEKVKAEEKQLPEPLLLIEETTSGPVVRSVEAEPTEDTNSGISESSSALKEIKIPTNLLDGKVSSELISLQSCPAPADRLGLIGGLEGVLSIIDKFNIKPSPMLCTAIMRTLPNSYAEENELTKFAEKSKVKMDIDFYNSILHRRAKNRKLKEAREILNRIENVKLTPNYRTYCIRAMLCFGYNDAKELLCDLKSANFQPGIVFFHSLVSGALKSPRNKKIKGHDKVTYPNYKYLSYLLKEIKLSKIIVNNELVKVLERVADWPEGYHRWKTCDPEFERELIFYRRSYNAWLKTLPAE